jgi:putative chitinase
VIDRKVFFDTVRGSLFKGGLSQPEVNGISAILDEWEKRSLSDLRWLAYMLATTFHETAGTMQPIREFGRGRGTKYGTTYYGRGFVQLTWETNYAKASKVVGVDLVKFPDRALMLPVAATILFDGMINGWFTGKKLADYISGATCDYEGARRIINGTDRKVLIAGYAMSFQKAIVGRPLRAP